MHAYVCVSRIDIHYWTETSVEISVIPISESPIAIWGCAALQGRFWKASFPKTGCDFIKFPLNSQFYDFGVWTVWVPGIMRVWFHQISLK